MRLGVDLGGTKIEAAAIDAAGAIRARRRVASPQDYDAKIRAIGELVAAIANEAGLSDAPVGVGHPGSINPRTGCVRNANSTDLNGRRLNQDLEAALGRPVRCANDANCFALSEARDGAAADARIVFGAILGTGVGGGVVVDGRLLSGADFIAGEWGHAGLPWARPDETPGPACKCGKRGCVEAWCSGPALVADYVRAGGQAESVEEIVEAASAGDSLARDALARHRDRLARSLATVVNILDPEAIVLGGGLSNLPGIAEDLNARLADWAFTDELRVDVRRNAHGDSSGVRGAAWLWPAPGEAGS
ncbi:fructokinase [Marinicauda salina]|uniref:Fructokinase n=1 Tax=Marinicauda salina TaxID=2135793 RepID=A0A2U2BR64_9PROT|nr:ROK family protein [Marinicauda salina]PWE16479.1 fructokinase [Marinicauda salina]